MSFSTATNFSSAISLISTSHAGRTRRIAIIGTRLWPPAMSFADSPCVASNAQDSASEAARQYSKGAAFNSGYRVRPHDKARIRRARALCTALRLARPEVEETAYIAIYR